MRLNLYGAQYEVEPDILKMDLKLGATIYISL